jgi:hypothetical protein
MKPESGDMIAQNAFGAHCCALVKNALNPAALAGDGLTKEMLDAWVAIEATSANREWSIEIGGCFDDAANAPTRLL